ncbi:MAG: extracellular solute-binding protein [Minisyncoccia bacterium]
MNQPKIFQIVVMAVFVILLILGFLGFSGKISLPTSGGEIDYGQVTLWGTYPQTTMQEIILANMKGNKSITINYVQKNAKTFNADFIEALASGKGPDLVLLAQDEIVKKMDKFIVIPYQTYPERDFKNTFIEEGEMFLLPNGVLALPFTIDPIVMYWNRDIFTSALIPAPPAFWSDFYDLVPKITMRDKDGNIIKSMVAFGEYSNVSHAKEIVSTLIMQAGSPIVVNTNGSFTAMLSATGGVSAENPVVTAMRFFIEFSKSDKDSYSWNRSLPESRAMFDAGDLALYFGYASEYASIRQKNPHLNFDVALLPQVSKMAAKLTFGRIHGAAIVAASKNQLGALYAASLLSGQSFVGSASASLGLPPVRRDLLAGSPKDAVFSVFYSSALIARAWYDPSPIETDSLFMTMIESVTSGRSSMNQSLNVAQSNMSTLLRAR